MTPEAYKRLCIDLGIDRGDLSDGKHFKPELESVCAPGKVADRGSMKVIPPKITEDLSRMNPKTTTGKRWLTGPKRKAR
jgi:hypothetical protein